MRPNLTKTLLVGRHPWKVEMHWTGGCIRSTGPTPRSQIQIDPLLELLRSQA
jgi:hypothetical protein